MHMAPIVAVINKLGGNMITVLDDKSFAVKYLAHEFYENLNACNYLQNVAEARAYIYNGDLNGGIIVAHDGGRNFLATKNPVFMSDWWKMLPQGHHFFPGVPNDIAGIFLKDRKPEWTSPCKVYALTGEFKHESKSKYKCETLTPQDAEEVDEHYTYRHEGTLESLRQDIISMDSSCVRIGGELAAWCLVHGDDGTLGPLYTKEKFRRQGLAELVSADLISKLVAKNILPYLHIAEGNDPSLGLIAKFEGMQHTHDCLWFGVVK